jgi:predicted O-linked N-acetylglucosamine transferase (SPINDLY family)
MEENLDTHNIHQKEEIEKLKVENEGLKKDLRESIEEYRLQVVTIRLLEEALEKAEDAYQKGRGKRIVLYDEMDELKEEIKKLKSQAQTLLRGSKRSAPEVFDGFMLLAQAQQKRNFELKEKNEALNEEIKKLKEEPKHKVYDDFMVLAKAQAKKIFELIEKNKALNKDIKKLKEDIPVGTRLNESIS